MDVAASKVPICQTHKGTRITFLWLQKSCVHPPAPAKHSLQWERKEEKEKRKNGKKNQVKMGASTQHLKREGQLGWWEQVSHCET